MNEIFIALNATSLPQSESEKESIFKI